VRNPIVLHVNKPTVSLCFLEHPIDFGALDGQPVTTLFALVSPSIRAHLNLLSRLGFVLRAPALREALRSQAAREALLAALAEAERAIPRVTPNGPVTSQ
jgi:PTS system nitrogen regulatory IIA component